MANKSLKQLFFWPIVIGFLTLTGLVVALLEDGMLEDLSLIALAFLILVAVYFYYYKPYMQARK